MKKEIQDYEEKLPEMKRRIEELTAREKEIDNECEAKMNDIKKADAELSTLEAREQELNQQMVDDNEYESCLSEIKAAENELVAVNQRIEHSKSSNVAECRAIDELEEYLKSIDAMIDRTEIAHVEQAVYASCNGHCHSASESSTFKNFLFQTSRREIGRTGAKSCW